ncbi:MAG: hypothetical protein NVSMB6_31630 [Burkholderiaceae bacterium]
MAQGADDDIKIIGRSFAPRCDCVAGTIHADSCTITGIEFIFWNYLIGGQRA